MVAKYNTNILYAGQIYVYSVSFRYDDEAVCGPNMIWVYSVQVRYNKSMQVCGPDMIWVCSMQARYIMNMKYAGQIKDKYKVCGPDNIWAWESGLN